MYSGEGARPSTGPLPINNGLMYNEPLPGGGTWNQSSLNQFKVITKSTMSKAMTWLHNTRTQRLFAKTVSFTASTNCSTVGDGMHIRSAPTCIRRPFSSGRNRSIFPSCFRYAFKPSNNPYVETGKQILHKTSTPGKFNTNVKNIDAASWISILEHCNVAPNTVHLN